MCLSTSRDSTVITVVYARRRDRPSLTLSSTSRTPRPPSVAHRMRSTSASSGPVTFSSSSSIGPRLVAAGPTSHAEGVGRQQHVDDGRPEREAPDALGREAGRFDGRRGVPRRVAAPPVDPRVDDVEGPLHPPEATAVGEHVLVEPQLTTRTDDPPQL